MKRVAVFAHYDSNDRVEDYVLDYLAGLKRVTNSVILVSTAKLDGGERIKLQGICDEVIVRDNEGYDFMSWSAGIQHFGRLFLEQCDELVLCNDSCYASTEAMVRMFGCMDEQVSDFWGVTDSFDYQYHIHSYFMVFRNRVLKSRVFWDFYTSIGIETNKVDITKKYEVGLTPALIKEGFSSAVYMRYPKVLLFWLACRAKFNVLSYVLARRFSRRPSMGGAVIVAKRRTVRKWLDILWIFLNPLNVNTTLFDWRRLIRKGSPFLKTTVTKSNVYQDARIGEWRSLASDHGFPAEKIQAHLDRLQNVASGK